MTKGDDANALELREFGVLSYKARQPAVPTYGVQISRITVLVHSNITTKCTFFN